MNQSAAISASDLTYSNASNLMARAGTIFGITLAITLVRCYIRMVMLKAFGKDDLTIVVAMVLAMMGFGCYIAEVPLGLGKRVEVLKLDQNKYRQLLKIRLVHQVVVTAGVTVVKISVAYMLLRLALHLSLLVLELLVFMCLPIAAIWDYRLRPPPMGTGDALCLSVRTFSNIALFNSIVNIVTDFLLAFLPIPVIWNLQLNRRTKMLLAFVLSLGIFASVAGIMKATVSSTILNDPKRFVHDKYSMWNFVELDVGIIAACLPAMKPLLNRFLQVARSVGHSHTTKAIRFSIHAPSSVGYAKQNEDFGSVLELGQCHGGSSKTTVSSKPPYDREASLWSIGRGNSCDKVTRPVQYDGSDHKSIIVTSDIRID